MTNPVLCADTISYEVRKRGRVRDATDLPTFAPHLGANPHPTALSPRQESAIRQWLESKNTSPMTGLPLDHTFLTANRALKEGIERWREEHPGY